MFCEDLSPYQYHGCPTGLPGTFSVGWLERSAPFNTGKVPVKVIDEIHRLAKSPIFLTRGVHHCEFCANAEAATGNGELWLRLSEGQIYVSPQLLSHYIEEHDYLPPAEFLAICNPQVESVPETECKSLMRKHMQRLSTHPSRDDILIELYQTQVFWHADSFLDLMAFQKHLDWLQGTESPLLTDSVGRRVEGYFLNMESRNPAAAYSEIFNRFEKNGPTPYMYRYRLVYLQESWAVVRP